MTNHVVSFTFVKICLFVHSTRLLLIYIFYPITVGAAYIRVFIFYLQTFFLNYVKDKI